MRKMLLATLVAVLAVPSVAQAAWPKTSGVVMPANTASVSASCSRADAVIDSWLRSQPTSARPVNYNSATRCQSGAPATAIYADMVVFCANTNYYCQAGGYWDCLVDWDWANSTHTKARVSIICTRR